MNKLFEVKNCSLSINKRKILDDINFEVKNKEIILLLGPNGSGKTTLLKTCVGIKSPETGVIELENHMKLSYFGHNKRLYSELTAIENLDLFNSLFNLEIDATNSLEEWGLENKAVKQFSEGQTYKLALSTCFGKTTNCFFLDEPSSSLDDFSTELLKKKIKKQAKTANSFFAIIATHDIARFGEFATKVLILEKGKIIFFGPPLQGFKVYRNLNR